MEMGNRLQPSVDSGNGDLYRVKQLFGGSLTLRDYESVCRGFGHGACAEQNDEGRHARKCTHRLRAGAVTEKVASNLIYSTKP